MAFALIAAGVAAGTIDFAAARIVSAIVLIVSTAALAIDLRWGGWSRDALTRLVIDLGDRAEATTLRDRLAAALDDPTLVIGYGLDDGGTYVDDDGRPVEVPARVGARRRPATPGRARGGRPRPGRAAAHRSHPGRWRRGRRRTCAGKRPAPRGDPPPAWRTWRRPGAADRRRGIGAQTDPPGARRVEPCDGSPACATALMASVALGPEREPLLEHARSVMRQLEELADGLGPASALEDGLGPALHRLAAESSVPAVADGPVGRLPPLVEATAFFVCSEGLANVAKHASASRASVRVHET